MYLPYGHVTNGDFPPLLREKTGELSDDYFVKLLFRQSRCSYFADTKLPLASGIIYLHYITEIFALLWEKTGELSDEYFVKL